MARLLTISTWFQGISIFLFGILKFFPPFNNWYASQISGSGLPAFFYWPGIFAEIVTGLLFIFLLAYRGKIMFPVFNRLLLLGGLCTSAIMLVAIYVHLQPAVPADVLPLKIKAPFIPAFYIVLTLFHVIQVKKIYSAAVQV